MKLMAGAYYERERERYLARRKRFGVFVLALVVALSIAGTLGTTNAAAAGPMGQFAAYGPSIAVILFVGALVMGVTAAGFYLADKKAIAMPVGIVTVVLVASGILVYFLASMSGAGANCIADPTLSQCKPGPDYVANFACNWLALVSTGPGGAHDASTEYPTAPFTAADGGTPDYDSTIATPVYQYDQSRARIDITVDDELLHTAGTGTNANTWLNEDTYAFEIQCFLANPKAAVGGGYQTVPMWGHIKTPRMYGSAGNSSTFPVFICDSNTGGVYLGFGANADTGAVSTAHDANHQWLTYRSNSAGSSCAQIPTEGDWISLGGTSTAAPQNGEYVSFWFVLDAGLISYEDVTITYTIQVDVGTAPNQTEYAGNVETLYLDLIATDD